MGRHAPAINDASADWLTGAVAVRRARPAEHRACRMLVPVGATQAGPVDLFVAVAAGRIVGAAALGRRADAAGGVPLDVHVVAPRRRQGSGRRLVDLACHAAAVAGRTTVFAAPWLDADAPSLPAVAALGFTAFDHRYEYAARVRDALDSLAPLHHEVIAHGWVPEGARIEPIAQVDPDRVVAFHARFFDTHAATLRADLTGRGTSSYDTALSFALFVDDLLIGYTLGRVFRDRGLCEVDWTAVEPGSRMGWANLYLRHHALAALHDAGVAELRYRALDQHSDTRRTFRKLKADLIGTLVRVRRSVPPTPAGVVAEDDPAP